MASSGAAQPIAVWQNKPKSVLTVDAPMQQPPRHPYSQQGYLPNGQPPAHQGPLPGAVPLLPNQGRVIQTGPNRVLCIADVRGTDLCPNCARFIVARTASS
jgi:hypothetical protein